MVKIKISSQLVFVDSNFSQFVLIMVSSFSFGQFVLIWSIRPLCLVNSYTFWLTRTHFGHLASRANGSCHFVLILEPLCIYRTEKETQNERMQCLKIMYCCEILNFAYT